MRFFFVLAIGRSGTAFLSSLLARAPRVRVHHEPYSLDPTLLGLRYAGFDDVVQSMLERRFRELVPETGATEIYGEVNSFLRYEALWLRRRFDPVLIHLVRDGRDFVRSAYTKEVYTHTDRQLFIVPRNGDPYAERWATMSRFQQICWYWHHSNDYLAGQLEKRARLEDIVSDYGQFRGSILDAIGAQVSEREWRRAVARPRNTSVQYRRRAMLRRLLRGSREPSFPPLPHWTRWEPALTAQFWEICGTTMERLGYSRNSGEESATNP